MTEMYLVHCINRSHPEPSDAEGLYHSRDRARRICKKYSVDGAIYEFNPVPVRDVDENCVCDGNWRLLVKEYSDKIGNTYQNQRTKELYIFYGLVWSDDDFYYGMSHFKTGKHVLFSCVGDLDGWDFKEVQSTVLKNTTPRELNYRVGIGGNLYVWSTSQPDVFEACQAIGKSTTAITYNSKHRVWTIRLKSKAHKTAFREWIQTIDKD